MEPTHALDVICDIRVIVESNQMVVYVDDVSVGTASWEGATNFASEVSIYVGDPWYDAARVTLSHICLKQIFSNIQRITVANHMSCFFNIESFQ